MNLTDEEIELVLEWRKVRDAFVKAKKSRAKDEGGYVKAKAAVDELRTYWRRVGEAAGTRTPVAPIRKKVG